MVDSAPVEESKSLDIPAVVGVDESAMLASASEDSSPLGSPADEADQIALAIRAWDDIGELAGEVASSMVVRQASFVCGRFLEDLSQPPAKRTKVSHPGPTVSDEDSASVPEKIDSARNVSYHVDRMSRMSNLMVLLDQTRLALRHEMVEMLNDYDEKYSTLGEPE